MSCKRVVLAGLLFLILFPVVLQAQVVRLQLNIETEIFTEEIQELFFGNHLPMAGTISIPLQSAGIGIYRISGDASLFVAVQIDAPTQLLHANPEFEDFAIPLELGFAYANREANNVQHAVLFNGNSAVYPMSSLFDSNTLVQGQLAPIVNSYLYVFGSIEIGDVPAGMYEADVQIIIEYQ